MTAKFVFSGYYPGLIGRVVELHGSFYAENWDFDVSFETQVAMELGEFMHEFKPSRDGVWAARLDGEFAGSVFIDGKEAMQDGARLRWFIVSPKVQGHGLGRLLLAKAVDFCRQRKYPKINLWTFKGLEAARVLYLDAGFVVTQEHNVDQWGGNLLEQRYDLKL
ncbi:GNAT family N-acetyltransferase [Dethiosulfatarculus sandiegensis]|uniref:GCN5 family acetyltransferase n=1 Tax=Dethiosulfatarculus sandiegensis TaxID=1429043 RepID=A0A0D2HQ16_9BACT|nr:GNAT family N-acetyltransferase [Dethiosulfatarculus sandiegensis]KIX12563.1 GCN5 family acetyltransferase [Dethiosulfatarculus sandiegensis]